MPLAGWKLTSPWTLWAQKATYTKVKSHGSTSVHMNQSEKKKKAVQILTPITIYIHFLALLKVKKNKKNNKPRHQTWNANKAGKQCHNVKSYLTRLRVLVKSRKVKSCWTSFGIRISLGPTSILARMTVKKMIKVREDVLVTRHLMAIHLWRSHPGWSKLQ